MNHFVSLYKKVRKDNPHIDKAYFYRAVVHSIVHHGTMEDLKEFENYYSQEEENETNQIA